MRQRGMLLKEEFYPLHIFIFKIIKTIFYFFQTQEQLQTSLSSGVWLTCQWVGLVHPELFRPTVSSCTEASIRSTKLQIWAMTLWQHYTVTWHQEWFTALWWSPTLTASTPPVLKFAMQHVSRKCSSALDLLHVKYALHACTVDLEDL